MLLIRVCYILFRIYAITGASAIVALMRARFMLMVVACRPDFRARADDMPWRAARDSVQAESKE